MISVGKVGSKNKEDAPHELESQFVLRLPSVRKQLIGNTDVDLNKNLAMNSTILFETASFIVWMVII